MKIEELNEKHIKAIKDLLVELQEYIVSIDNFKLNILSYALIMKSLFFR